MDNIYLDDFEEVTRATSYIIPKTKPHIEFSQPKFNRSFSETYLSIKGSKYQKIKNLRRNSIIPQLNLKSKQIISLRLHRHFQVQDSQGQQNGSSSENQSSDQNIIIPQTTEQKQSSHLKKLIKLIQMLLKFCSHNIFEKIQQKLLQHFSKLSNADKYLRLLISFIKVHKVFNQKSKFLSISKQMARVRRIVQWTSKYQIIHQLKCKQLSTFEVIFKTLELSGNLFDFGGFWLELFERQYPFLKPYISLLSSWQSDCYFYQCFISLCIYFMNTVLCIYQYRYINLDKTVYLESKQNLNNVETIYNQLANKLQYLKTLRKQSKSSKAQKEALNEQINKFQKLTKQKEKQYRQAGENYHIIQKKIKDELKQDIQKNSIKTVKFAFDVATSYNNYSKKKISLDPLTGGIYSIISSVISMYLIWAY